ncbi:MBL fold metallo-hydrolase [Candidatus Woesearchaeota archaeon]|nr:MBL fold metallo-hydrolase [Candidatus Woesearchaeota archaeon]
MKIKFHGTRGSVPTPSTEDFSTVKYGGNTTCVSIRPENSNELYILDAGSGIRVLGNELMKSGEGLGKLVARFFITHVHWDHVQGFPFFVPAYVPGNVMHCYAYDSRCQDTKKALADQQKQADNKPTDVMRKTTGTRAIGHKAPEDNHPKRTIQDVMDTKKKYFPVSLEEMASSINFNEIRKNEEIQGPLKVTYKFLNTHPQGYAYWRFSEDNGGSMVFASDYESDGFLKTGVKGTLGELDQQFVKFAQGATVLVLDGQYTPEQYQKSKTWGHNDIEQACHIAKAANVKILYLTHHDPNSNDNKLDQMQQHAKDYMRSLGSDIEVVFAREGQVADVPVCSLVEDKL